MKIDKKIKKLPKTVSNLIEKETAPPPMLRDLRRNFETLVLGGSRIWESYRYNTTVSDLEDRIMFAARPCRTVEGQWWTLQHMHSYLRKGGTVIITIDLGDRTQRCRGFTYCDARIFHPVVNDSLGLRYHESIRSCSWRFYPGYCLVLLSIVKRHAKKRRLLVPDFWVRNRLVGIGGFAPLRGAVEFLAEAQPFCKERGLRLQLAVILPKEITERKLDQVKMECSKQFKGFDFSVHPQPEEFLQNI